jgi:tetratricopeptide (TPR) repeat protein
MRYGPTSQPKQRRRQRGFIIFGWRTIISNESVPPLRTICPSCRREAHLQGRTHRRWFTLYFIPVFPVGSATRFTECVSCKAQFRGTIEQLRNAVAASTAKPFEQAIALYNQMKDTPNDSAKLLQLMQMYAGMKEPGEAISAATAFPGALHNSDLCLNLLGLAYLAKKDRQNALASFTAALALNPNNTDAQKWQDELLANPVSA